MHLYFLYTDIDFGAMSGKHGASMFVCSGQNMPSMLWHSCMVCGLFSVLSILRVVEEEVLIVNMSLVTHSCSSTAYPEAFVAGVF